MIPKIVLTDREQELGHLVVLVPKWSKLPGGLFTAAEKNYLKQQADLLKKELAGIDRLGTRVWVWCPKEEKEESKRLEAARKEGHRLSGLLNREKATRITLFDAKGMAGETLALAEGMALACYRFLKYRKDPEGLSTLESIEIYSETLDDGDVDRLNTLVRAVAACRDLINEPHSHLTATRFAREAEKMAEDCGASAEVFNRQKIAALKMGGLLGVNQGSHEPPTFTVMEWNPPKAVNKKPVVLVGKGVMYDTGGMNLKPGDTMLNMKDDMSGAAAVACTVWAAAKANLPVRIVGLMPATDNRPGPKAIVSGDILTMHNGMTVEVINTDAEGRLILADALSYARRYDPALVIELSTLTGSAVRAIGKFGAAAMHSNAQTDLEMLKKSGLRVFERLAEFPMWDEYGEQIRSEVADIKNLGPAEAGLITAAKFLEKFTSYPYIHLDIAGPSFAEKEDSYRGQGGTGFGVRLLFDFLCHRFPG